MVIRKQKKWRKVRLYYIFFQLLCLYVLCLLLHIVHILLRLMMHLLGLNIYLFPYLFYLHLLFLLLLCFYILLLHFLLLLFVHLLLLLLLYMFLKNSNNSKWNIKIWRCRNRKILCKRNNTTSRISKRWNKIWSKRKLWRRSSSTLNKTCYISFCVWE